MSTAKSKSKANAKAKLLAQMYGTKSSGTVSCATVRKGKKRRKKKRGGIVVVDDASIRGKFSAEAVDAKWESWERKGLGDEPVVVGGVVGGKTLVANASRGTNARARGRRRIRKRRVAASDSDSDIDVQRKSTKTPSSSSDSDMEVRRKPGRAAANSDSSDSDMEVRRKPGRAAANSDSSDSDMEVRRKPGRATANSDSSDSSSDSSSDLDVQRVKRKRNSRARTAANSSDTPTKRSNKSDSDSDSDMDVGQRPAKGASKQKRTYTRATGQITAAQLSADQKRRQEREEAELHAAGALKPNAETVYRDVNGNVIKDVKAMMAEKAKEDAKYTLTKQEEQRQNFSVNMGAADKRRIVEKREMLHKMKSVPFARKLGGAESREHDLTLRDQIRADDPMAAYMKAKREKRRKKDRKKKSRKIYKGPAPPPHRFGQEILPGYRWDGVDRSNGHEKTFLAEQAHRNQDDERAYKWRTSDM